MSAACQFDWCDARQVGHEAHLADLVLPVEIANDEGEITDNRLVVRVIVHTGPRSQRPPTTVVVGLVSVYPELDRTDSMSAQLSVDEARSLRDMLDQSIRRAEEGPVEFAVIDGGGEADVR